jgi:uncharacterized repeat protein (TIGR03843 family)
MLDSKTAQQWLQTGRMEVEGLLPWSSNYTFLVQIQPPPVTERATKIAAVYKPRQGERPLWDFPRATLCNREYATFLVSEALGWDLVPPTVLREGPHGIGSVQLFIEHDPENHYFTFEGDPNYRPQLQKIVLLDAIINNADRKGGHILVEERPGDTVGRLWGIDHGLGFHVDYKLRTVVWEFAGDEIPPGLTQALQELADQVAADRDGIRSRLQELLTQAEVQTFQRRVQQLLLQGTFPTPGPGRPYPWPPV